MENNINLGLAKNLPNLKNIEKTLKKIQKMENESQNNFTFSLKKYKTYRSFSSSYEVLKFFSKSGYNKFGNEDIFKNISTLKKIKKIKIPCRMEFVYALIMVKKH